MRREGGGQHASSGCLAGEVDHIVGSAFVLFPSLTSEEREDGDIWGAWTVISSSESQNASTGRPRAQETETRENSLRK